LNNAFDTGKNRGGKSVFTCICYKFFIAYYSHFSLCFLQACDWHFSLEGRVAALKSVVLGEGVPLGPTYLTLHRTWEICGLQEDLSMPSREEQKNETKERHVIPFVVVSDVSIRHF
jgi:hypothetical protein